MMKGLLPFLLIISTTCWAKNKPITVFVPDTGVDISHVTEIRNHINIANWTKEDYVDLNGHGTHVAGIVLKDTCPEIELISCKYYTDSITEMMKKSNLTRSIECFKKALTQHIDIINYSSGGDSFSQEEFDILKKLSDKGIKIVVAAGNNGEDLKISDYYPAKYKLTNIIVVGNLNVNKNVFYSSNFNLPGMVWEIGVDVFSTLPNSNYGSMSGTSMAAAIHTNKMLKEKCNAQK